MSFAKADRASPNGIYAIFFLEAFMLGNWIPRIPDLKTQFDISATILGFCLFALAVGTLVSFLVGGKIVRRLGLAQSCRFTVCGWAIGIGLAPFMPGLILLFPLLFVAGILVGLCEIAMNTAADGFEREHDRRIMSKSHGFWSLGTLAGALLGAGAAAADVAMTTHFAAATIITCVLGWLSAAGIFVSSQEVPSAIDEPTFKLPRRDLMALCLMPIGIMIVEGAFIDWSALFVRTVLLGDAVASGAIYAAFSAVMAFTRLLGDSILERYGPYRVAQVSAISAIVGMSLFALAPNITLAFVAALFSGLGVAIVYPLTMSEAAKRPGQAADNVAAVSLFAFTSFMFAPPAIGMVSDFIGLRYALLAIVPIAIISLMLTGELRRTVAKAKQ